MKFEVEALRSELYEIGMNERAVIPIIDAIQNDKPGKAKQLMLISQQLKIILKIKTLMQKFM